MKVDIKEISKISLGKDELLLIQIPNTGNLYKAESEKIKRFKEFFPKEWNDRVIFIIGDVKLTKAVKQ